MIELQELYTESPIGAIRMTATPKGLASLSFVDKAKQSSPKVDIPLRTAALQIEEYFNKKRRKFDIPLDLHGSEFQTDVWKYLMEVPYGRVATYLDIALRFGDRHKVRAVGTANSKNPIAIIVPCHRIVGSDGSLSGYAGGVWRKEWLLLHEKAINPIGEQLSIF